MGECVLVTGAEGFIGSHLTEHLLASGQRVRALILYNSFNSYGWLEGLTDTYGPQLEIVFGDIRDPHAMLKLVDGVSCIYHLAALISIPHSYHAPDMYVAVNIQGTLNLLQAARQAETPRFLLISSSEVYGTAQYVPIDEIHPLQAQSPYSATKIAAERLAESFFLTYGLPVVRVRPFNTYGPRQSARAVIPTIITQLLAGRKTIQLGALTPTRDLNYVGDTVMALVRIASTAGLEGEVLNIASGREISIGKLARQLIGLISPDARLQEDPQRLRPAHSEVMRLWGSADKLKRLTGWSPSLNLEQGLAKTVEWFRLPVNLSQYKPQQYNI